VTAAALLDRLAPGPDDGVRAARGREWLLRHGLPSAREEAWRHTPVDEVVAALATARPPSTTARAALTAGLDRAVVDRLAGAHGGPRLVLVDGILLSELSDLDPPTGSWLGGAVALRPRRRPGPPPPADEPVDGFHALNWAAGRDVAAVLVDPGAAIDVPIHVVHLTTGTAGAPTAVHPRTVVRVGPGARAHVIESFVSAGLIGGSGIDGDGGGAAGGAVVNASTRLVAAEGSTITHHRIVALPAVDLHLGRTGIDLGAGAVARSTSVTTGGAVVRNAIDVRLAGDGARVDLDGLDRPIGHERHDTVLTVDHAASRCTSTQRFKSIVADHGRSSFGGHVIVRPGTVGTDASQSNPNLLLASTAQADTRPWLEIFADDVRCSHGATVGRLDDDALFYLRSRGLPVAVARSVLVDAFAAEILDAVGPGSLRDHLAGPARSRPGEAG